MDLPVPGSPPTSTSRTRPAIRWAGPVRGDAGRRATLSAVALGGTDGGHLGPDLRAVGHVVVLERRRPDVGRRLPVVVEEPLGQVGPAEVLEVHGEERGVGQAVAEPERVVELDAVEDAGPVVEAEDVVGEEVAVAVDGPPVGDPLLEQRAATVEEPIGEPLDRLDGRASTMSGVCSSRLRVLACHRARVASAVAAASAAAVRSDRPWRVATWWAICWISRSRSTPACGEV